MIDQIRYTGFIDEQGNETFGNAVVDFGYNDDERDGKLFYEGEDAHRNAREGDIALIARAVQVAARQLDAGGAKWAG